MTSSVGDMSSAGAVEKEDWFELGQQCLLLQASLRCLAPRVKADKRLKEHFALVWRVTGATAQANGFRARLREEGYNFERAKNVWCSLAMDYLLCTLCCDLMTREPTCIEEEEAMFRLSQLVRLQGPPELELAPGDSSWFDPVKSYELLDANVNILIQHEDVLFWDFFSECGISQALASSRVSEEGRTCTGNWQDDMDAWRFCVARHLADNVSAMCLATARRASLQ